MIPLDDFIDPASFDRSKLKMFSGERMSFTRDPVTLSQLNRKNHFKPGVKNTTNSLTSRNFPFRTVDQIEFNITLFLQIDKVDSDLTIVPINLRTKFGAKIRDGPRHPYG